MGVDPARVVHLRAADDDAVRPALHHAHELVRVGLLGRTLRAMTLRVGHRTREHEIVALRQLEEAKEPLVVVGAFA